MPKPVALERKVTVEDSPEAATRRAIEYLREIGFKGDDGSLTLARGSRLAPFFSITPGTMPTTVRLDPQSDPAGNRVTVEFTVKPPLGTSLAELELDFWRDQLDRVDRCLNGQWVERDADSRAQKMTELATNLHLLSRFLGFVLIMAIWGLAVWGIPYLLHLVQTISAAIEIDLGWASVIAILLIILALVFPRRKV